MYLYRKPDNWYQYNLPPSIKCTTLTCIIIHDSVVSVQETQKVGSGSASTLEEKCGNRSGNTSTISEQLGSASGPITRNLVDFEGFQPVVNRKKKREFFQQTLTIKKINDYYDKKEQELMDLLSGIEKLRVNYVITI